MFTLEGKTIVSAEVQQHPTMDGVSRFYMTFSDGTFYAVFLTWNSKYGLPPESVFGNLSDGDDEDDDEKPHLSVIDGGQT